MDSPNREQLKQLLEEYIFDTFRDIETVRTFCDGEPEWTLQRESELEMMRDIKVQADQISLKFDRVKRAENEFKTFGKYLWSRITQVTADSQRQKLEKELGSVLKNTLEGLEKLHHFLDALERLAVTSLFVFMSENIVLRGVSPAAVRSMISTTRLVSPLLIHYKRDAAAFFMPHLCNVEVLSFQLDKYIRITQQLCERLEKKSKGIFFSGGICDWKNSKSSLVFILNVSEDSVSNLYDHLEKLIKIRMDESFKLTFLFSDDAFRFTCIFRLRSSRMLQFLSDLEESAVQLDRMKLGSRISSVAGSSVGIAGGVLSIVGLALAPVTAGVSLALTLTGVGLGVTSGVNTIVTGLTEMGVNLYQGKNASKIFIRFMKDVQKVVDCMEKVANSEGPGASNQEVNVATGTVKVLATAGAVAKGIDALVDGASAVKVLGAEEVFVSAVNLGLQDAKTARGIPSLAADLPDIGQLAKGTPLALSKAARAGFIGLNAFFIGVDALFICKESINLAKGKKSETAQVIRYRTALWRSEMEAWKKIYECLCKGIRKLHKNQKILHCKPEQYS